MLILNVLCRRSQFPQLQQRQLLLLSSRVRQTVSQGSCQEILSQKSSVECSRISSITHTNTRTLSTSSQPQHCQFLQTTSIIVHNLKRNFWTFSRSPYSIQNRFESSKQANKINFFAPFFTSSSSAFTFFHTSPSLPSSGLSLKTPYPPSYYFEMSSKHLGPGTKCPPLQDGKLRIYNMRFCPFAQRALLVAIAKGIPHDVVNINLKQKPEWIFEKNPMGKVPTIELNSQDVLYESLVVSDYLDEAHPNRPLQSSDPFRKALDRIMVENFGKIISGFYKLLGSQGNAEELKTNFEVIRGSWGPFEKELEKRGTKFFGAADAPGMVDYMIWPWVERLSCLKLFFPDLSDYEKHKKENPRLEEWRQAMKADPAVKELYLTPEQHQRFIVSHLAGNPDYDFLEE